MRLRKTLKTKRAKRRVNRNKRQVKPKVKQSRPKRIIQRAVDNIREHILRSEEYQEYVDELQDWDFEDLELAERKELELDDENETNVYIEVEPVMNNIYRGFKTYYIVINPHYHPQIHGRDDTLGTRVFIQRIRTGPGYQDDTNPAFGA